MRAQRGSLPWAPQGAGGELGFGRQVPGILRLFGAKKVPLPPQTPFPGREAVLGILKSPLLRKHKARLGLRGRQIWFPSDQCHTAVNKIVTTWADNKRQLYPAPILQRFGGFRDHGDTFSYLLPSPSPPIIPRPSIGFSQSLFQQMLQCFDPRSRAEKVPQPGCYLFLLVFRLTD